MRSSALWVLHADCVEISQEEASGQCLMLTGVYYIRQEKSCRYFNSPADPCRTRSTVQLERRVADEPRLRECSGFMNCSVLWLQVRRTC